MNRRALALVSAVVLLIVAAAWWLSTEEPLAVPAPERSQPQPVLTPPDAPLRTVEVTEAPAPRSFDAGVALMAEVEIEVIENGQRQIGTRIELEGPGGREGRPTDIMGLARFSLVEGEWRVTSPPRRYRTFEKREQFTGRSLKDMNEFQARLRTTPFQVRAPITRLRIEFPVLKKISGRVVDLNGAPIRGARIAARESEFGPEMNVTMSGPTGGFSFETDSERLLLRAHYQRSSSTFRPVTAPGEVTLVLEPWTTLELTVTGPFEGAPVRVRVISRGEFSTESINESLLIVPVGRVELVARRAANGQVFSGRTSATTTLQGPNHADILLSPAQPIRGRVVDTGGRPVAGITVTANELEGLELPDAGANATTLTGSSGEFSLAPSGLRSTDPVFQLVVSGAWRTTRPSLVRLDDGPVELAIEPQ